MRRSLAAVAAIAAAVALGIAVWPAGEQSRSIRRPSNEAAIAPASDVGTPPRSEPAAPTVATPSNPASLAPSLAGTRPDGAIALDGNGLLVPDAGLRRLFDHFLSVIGERDVPAIRAALAAHLDATQGGRTVGDVLAAFDRYVAYQRALADLNPGAIADAAQRFDAVRKLRRRMLGDALADGLFADEEAYTAHTLERLRIARDATLTDSERQERLAAHDATLGEAHRAARETTTSAALIDEQSRQLDALDVDPATRRAERAALWGAEAADRLATLDAERAAWDARVADYVRRRDAIRANAALDAATRAQRETALRDSMFSEPERRRVQSLEDAGLLEPRS